MLPRMDELAAVVFTSISLCRGVLWVNQTFEPCLSRVCDFLYLYLTKVQPKEPVIPLSQGELAKIAGASQAQMERCVQILKKEEVLATSRKQLAILDEKKIAGPLHAGACGKICEKKGRFPSVRGERFSVVWYAGIKKSPQGVTTHESL